mmetsp:Transcript_78835/g.157553  ORF Transcript_78835/g.157553 Transcript_78835/m.157553 type:complete len:200 (-) Transcript_78835:121-720(-)
MPRRFLKSCLASSRRFTRFWYPPTLDTHPAVASRAAALAAREAAWVGPVRRVSKVGTSTDTFIGGDGGEDDDGDKYGDKDDEGNGCGDENGERVEDEAAAADSVIIGLRPLLIPSSFSSSSAAAAAAASAAASSALSAASRNADEGFPTKGSLGGGGGAARAVGLDLATSCTRGSKNSAAKASGSVFATTFGCRLCSFT